MPPPNPLATGKASIVSVNLLTFIYLFSSSPPLRIIRPPSPPPSPSPGRELIACPLPPRNSTRVSSIVATDRQCTSENGSTSPAQRGTVCAPISQARQSTIRHLNTLTHVVLPTHHTTRPQPRASCHRIKPHSVVVPLPSPPDVGKGRARSVRLATATALQQERRCHHAGAAVSVRCGKGQNHAP